MIREISIKNFALIDNLTIELDKGFSVFTGETGAGKSILIGAISLLLGERASNENIRKGAGETEIIGVFELDKISPSLEQLLSEANISAEDNSLIIRRTVSTSGRNRIYINQIPIPLSTLKAIGNHLVDLHGQHDHQSLLRPETAGIIINSLPDTENILQEYSLTYNNYLKAKNNLEEHDKKAAELAQKRDLIEFQYNEISGMKLYPDEETNLEKDFKMLSSVTERLESVSNISKLIEGSEEYNSLNRQIAEIRRNLETLLKFDPSASPWIDDIENNLSFFSELSSYCSSYLENTETEATPERLEQINNRLAKIQRLKKKYQYSLPELIKKQNDLKNQLDTIENTETDREELLKNAKQTEKTCYDKAKMLTRARIKSSQQFDKDITKQMGKLGFSGGKWKTVFSPESALTSNGLESIAFEVQTNIGEPFLPLIKTASGGEISRLMLAIKTILAANDNIPILIFDEIDTGIGGNLAKEVGQSLYELSRLHQVLCISHLHHIASMADHHYKVYKVSDKNRTVTRIFRLSGEEKIEEISRMLGGSSTISKKHAEEILHSKKDRFSVSNS